MSQPTAPILAAILHASREDCLFRTVAAVAGQNSAPCDILVVDSSAEPGLGARLQKAYPGLLYRKTDPDTGIASGRNEALRFFLDREYSYILNLDNDIELEKGCLGNLLRELEKNPSTGLAAPYMLNIDGRVLSSGGAYLRNLGQPVIRRQPGRGYRNNDFATGAIGLIRRQVVERVGLFDPLFDPYGFEDIDYCLRIRDCGYDIAVASTARCLHFSEFSFHRPTSFNLYHTTKKRLFCARKHVPFISFILFFFPWYFFRRVLLPVLKFLALGRPELSRAAWNGFTHGLREFRADGH
ncbi:MAG: glycosyltransferase family 2 protein [Desulfobacterales bacterium]|nr:glycosyltransferase family 2 protein [Desulfobacterales bacterium]